jgi:hypothetical protein
VPASWIPRRCPREANAAQEWRLAHIRSGIRVPLGWRGARRGYSTRVKTLPRWRMWRIAEKGWAVIIGMFAIACHQPCGAGQEPGEAKTCNCDRHSAKRRRMRELADARHNWLASEHHPLPLRIELPASVRRGKWQARRHRAVGSFCLQTKQR